MRVCSSFKMLCCTLKMKCHKKRNMVVKQKYIFLLLCLIIAWLVVADTGAAPLVMLDFDDANALSTANQGSLGGTQALSGYNGWGAKDSSSASAPTTFDSDTSWWSMFVADNPSATYGDFNLPQLDKVTVALWVNPGDFLGWRNIFSSEDTSGNMTLGVWFEGSTLHFTGGSAGNVDVTNVFTIGQWTHVAISYNSAGATKVYIDGVDTAFTGGWASLLAAGTAGITIGTPPAGSFGFNGLLDNLLIYDYALTQEEVQNVMLSNSVCVAVDDYFVIVSDLNADCYVDLLDLAIFADEWLTCFNPEDELCESPWE